VAGRWAVYGTADAQVLARAGRLDSGAAGPLPLGNIIDVNVSRSVAVGNINGGTYSFWRNQYTDSTATTFVGFKNELNQTYNNCSKGVGGSPDLLLGTQAAWETYWLSLTTQERYLINDKKTVDVLGGSEALAFRGSAFIWDEVVPDTSTGTNIVDSPFTANVEATIFFINSEAMSFVTDSETDFITTDFVRPENQDAKVAQVLWMGAVTVNNRRKLGTMNSISQSITS